MRKGFAGVDVVILAISGIGAMIAPYLTPAIGAFFMNYSVESAKRKDAIANGREYHKQTTVDEIMVTVFGGFLGWSIVEIGTYFGIPHDIKRPVAGIIGAISPHIIRLLSDRDFVDEQLKRWMPKR